jgi:type II secretory ATPase GspE/PulE/Tfp pilus assembly ATPase PilB-like protein
MPTVLDPKSLSRDPNSVNISVVSDSRTLRVKRLKDDLDHAFTESDTSSNAAYLGYPYIDLYGYPIDSGHLTILTLEEVKKYQMGVFSISGKTAYLGTPKPGFTGQNELIATLKNLEYTTKLFYISNLSFAKLLKAYKNVVFAETPDDNINIQEDVMTKYSDENLDFTKIEDLVAGLPLSQIIETILAIALTQDASDIHFEPEKDSYNLRFRLDGVLHTAAHIKKNLQHGIESRIKILSGAKLNVDNIPQDGRFSFKASGKEIDIRVSMLPSNYGYSVVMRLLGTGSVKLILDDLGFTGIAKERVQVAIERPQGCILTTGPTGSGKTTTLYTFLNTLNDGETKIITLEDPIEYKLPGISQTQIDAKAGYTFASGLRSIMRQDPDLVMIGEIRDGETAEIAVQASLTGHQVLSTIHTNDAAGAIPRLMEMGIKGFLLADSLQAVIGQRLVRKICQHCKIIEHLDEKSRGFVIDALSTLPQVANVPIPEILSFYTSPGCDECGGLGYKGRLGCYEVMTMTDTLRELISEKYPSIVQVRQTAMKDGMITMFQDGVLKAMAGITDMREILSNIDPGT